MPTSTPPCSSEGEVALGSGEVHLHLARCSSISEPALLARYRELMSPRERDRQARYRFERDRHRDLIARALVRTTLSRYATRAPADWQFTEGEHGKPEIVDPPAPLRFNLSHSRDLVVCGVTARYDLGVDVEYLARTNDVLAIARHYFSEREVEELFALPGAAQRDRFFDYWTLKEAYIKARGQGISLGLGNFSFLLSGYPAIDIAFAPALDDEPADWQFRLFRPEQGYRMALAWRRGGAAARVRSYDVVPLGSCTEAE